MEVESSEDTPKRTNEFNLNPIKKQCQYCEVVVTTYVEHEVNPYFGLLSLFTIIIFGFFSFVYLPLAFFLTKNAVHRCSRCLMKMGEKSCYGLPEDYS